MSSTLEAPRQPLSPEVDPNLPSSITCDRLLGRFVDSFALDTDRLADFYDSIDIPNKPPLSDLIIHFSVNAYTDERPTYDEEEDGGTTNYSPISGRYYENGLSSDDAKSAGLIEIGTTDKPTVVVFLGAYLDGYMPLDGDGIPDDVDLSFDSTLSMLVTRTVSHEVVHHAQRNYSANAQNLDRWIRPSKMEQLMMRWSKSTQRVFKDTVHLALDKVLAPLAGDTAVTREDIEQGSYEAYLEAPREAQARKLEDAQSGIVEIASKPQGEIAVFENDLIFNERDFFTLERMRRRRAKQKMYSTAA